jgi:uncharacterized protein (TIGR02266 family)
MIQHGDRGGRVEKRGHFRRKPRAGRRITVRYSVLDGDGETRGPVESAFTVNIGVGGAFIASEDPPAPGSVLVLSLSVPPLGRTIELRGDVRWIADGDDDDVHGMGVRFQLLDEDRLQVLNEYFASLTATVDIDEAV